MSNDKQHDGKKRTGELVEGKFALPAKPARLFEDLHVVRLEGRYFCFEKHEAKKRAGVYTYRDGNRKTIIDGGAPLRAPCNPCVQSSTGGVP